MSWGVPLCSTDSGDQPELEFRKGKACLFRAEDHISEEGKFASATQCHSIDSRENGFLCTVDGVVQILEDVIVVEVFSSLPHEFLDVSASAEGLGDFAEEEDDLHVIGGLVGADGLGDGIAHIETEGIEVGGRVEVDVSDLVLDLGLDLAEEGAVSECGEEGGDSSHILIL